ncbi:EamA family transporter|nr:EamA family transporter [archaeon]
MNWLLFSLFAMVIQGTVLFLVKFFSLSVHPLVILLFQYFGSFVGVSSYLLYKGLTPRLSKRELGVALLSGFLVSTGLSFYYLAISLTSASRVVPLHNVGITLIPSLLGFVFLKEKVDKRVVIGLIFSIISIIFLTI